ncbi:MULTISPECIES: PH domain-containing protein [Priestia]|uniref:PH domain-containing protein n=1 Tax=Priestia TaxID=2800373 RepID=UPI00234F1836|nr:PH domain-containing protein [Priestia megaterium]MDC7719754.1 PH domain-containing protein [Priestia megaterium]MED4240301.1 PH domain-containing protein [Priestia megaterium]MED4251549.1 PH domain-containing protein [Priestia megaterium]MED4264230.1 PH domain-containing protein [Priestia megaterium]MED4278068.1 PH domain-containing protein [Priestia megaterium]
MFGKVAADVLGLSDIGSVIKPVDYDKVDADDYVMHEEQEKIYFLIKSKSDEYCFTNKALIHLDGTSATSKKRMLRRYNYSTNHISNVMLETAGTVDLDVEIKFKIGSETFSIDVHKKHIEEVKDLYKALFKMSEITRENEIALDFAKQSIQLASSTLSSTRNTSGSVAGEFKEINEAAFSWLLDKKIAYTTKDFSSVFELYINN